MKKCGNVKLSSNMVVTVAQHADRVTSKTRKLTFISIWLHNNVYNALSSSLDTVENLFEKKKRLY